jgi:uncharacterized membrane protein YphA (DoxX/SURF4 family)
VLLRVSLSAYGLATGLTVLFSPAPQAVYTHAAGVVDFLSAVLLLAGFLTPIAGVLFLLATILESIQNSPIDFFANLNQASMFVLLLLASASLVLLGPGLFSLDARLFGRREIIIPQRGKQGPSSPHN